MGKMPALAAGHGRGARSTRFDWRRARSVFHGILWLAWAGYWLASARSRGASRCSESWQSGVSYWAPLAAGTFLMAAPQVIPPPGPDRRATGEPLPPHPPAALAMQVAGLGLTVWARRHLGRYWSAVIALKDGHRVVQSGPYGVIRHPIYAGLILALLGTAICLGSAQRFLALGFLLFSFLRKLVLEEAWLCEHLGAEYRGYRSRVKALVPFVW